MHVFPAKLFTAKLESDRLDIRRRLMWDTIGVATASDLAPFSGTFAA